MRNQPPDKYTVAWFKLAECVSRGEKERALGVYRLLAHSLHDQAFARQLQGDILCAFNDSKTAIEHYKTAAQLYQQDHRLLEAAAMYEHILLLDADKQKYLAILIELYSKQHMISKVTMHLTTLFYLLLAQDQIEDAAQCIDTYSTLLSSSELVPMRQQLIVAWLEKDKDVARIMSHIIHLVDMFMVSNKAGELPRLLTSLQALNTGCYRQVCDYIEHADYKELEA